MKRLAILRQRLQTSLRHLSQITGISVPTISAIEANRPGNLYPLEQVAGALGAGLFLHASGTALPFYSTAAISSNFQSWGTPPEILEKLYPIVGGQFDLDPCSPTRDKKKASVNAKIHYTHELDHNGLTLPWHGTVYANPPYDKTLKSGSKNVMTKPFLDV